MRNKLIYRIAMIAMLAAVCCVLRIWLSALPNVKPITALFFVFVLTLGLADSLWIMAITMVVTGLVLGFSPIIIGQVLVYGLVILIFKGLSVLTRQILVLSVLTGLLAMVYGALMDIFSGIMFGFGTAGFVGYWIAGLPFDLAHAVSTLIFFPLIVLVFRRIKPLS